MRLIDANTLNKELQKRVGSPTDDKLYEVNLCIIAAPTVPAIPVEWIEWRIAHAEREGFGAVVSMLRTVRDWWNDQRDVWEREQEAR